MSLVLLLCGLLPLQEQYNAGNYELVVARAESVLAEPGLTRSDSLLTRQLYAFSLVALGRNGEAAVEFRRLLADDPDMVLDPNRVSPKIRAVFEAVKAELPHKPLPVRVDTVLARRSVPFTVLVPGISQIQGRRPGKGYALLGAGVLSLAGLAVSHFSYGSSHRDYLEAAEPQQILDGYNTANAWYRARTAFGGAAVAVWLASLLDGVFQP